MRDLDLDGLEIAHAAWRVHERGSASQTLLWAMDQLPALVAKVRELQAEVERLRTGCGSISKRLELELDDAIAHRAKPPGGQQAGSPPRLAGLPPSTLGYIRRVSEQLARLLEDGDGR